MTKKKSAENKEYVTIQTFNDAINKIVISIDADLHLQELVKNNQDSLFSQTEKLVTIISALKKENDALRSDVRENKQAIEAILIKFNLELKKVVKDKDQSKESVKVLGLHDDYTDRCPKCRSIMNRKDKSCPKCGSNKK